MIARRRNRRYRTTTLRWEERKGAYRTSTQMITGGTVRWTIQSTLLSKSLRSARA